MPLPAVTFGRTGLSVARLGLGGFPFGAVDEAAGWNPYTPEGEDLAVRTVRRALDLGIDYLDTAPGYGAGRSEEIFGKALDGVHAPYTLATKCAWHGVGAEEVTRSVEVSLGRLRRDCVDVVQLHGGRFTPENVRHILEGGPADALSKLRDQGKVRFLGFTCEEPFTALPLLDSGLFDVVQLRYNLLAFQAAEHALPAAQQAGLGVAVMRPLTSGILQRVLRDIAPEWVEARDPWEVCLAFVLCDPRVHVALVGMRGPEEVERNVRMVENFTPPLDLSQVPPRNAGVYREDGLRNPPRS